MLGCMLLLCARLVKSEVGVGCWLLALVRMSSLRNVISAVGSKVKVLPEVAAALRAGRAVVALESTIVAHGMPYPQNFELAKEVSHILREKGVIPATIAVKDGIFRAGLELDELENLAKAGEENRAIKCSTRDLPLMASNNIITTQQTSDETVQWGATTVAATMRLAHAADIVTFVTGGTGGVHRGGELSLDISTDLIELSRTPVIVVSAGVKSILDVKRTLEVLETFGVPVGAWITDEFPAFFSPESGVKAPSRFNDAMSVARAYISARELGMDSGMLVAVPNHDPAGENVEKAIKEALYEAEAAGIEGRDVTPFILRTVNEKTGGDSLRSNMALVKNNAAVGADIALAVSNMQRKSGTTTTQSIQLPANDGDAVSYAVSDVRSKAGTTIQPIQLPESGGDAVSSRVVCVGGSVIDIIAKSSANEKMIIGTSNPGRVFKSDGGVGRNVAEVLGRLGDEPLFYTSIGKADGGEGILSRLTDCGVLTSDESVHFADGVSASYVALLDDKSDLVGGIADMDANTKIPTPSVDALSGVDFVLIDSNAPSHVMVEAAANAVKAGASVFFEPTSVPKAKQICKNDNFIKHVSYAFPNEDELFAMSNTPLQTQSASDDGFEHVKHAASNLLSRMRSDSAHVVVTLGSRGAFLASKVGESSVEHTLFTAEVIPKVSSNGAGDTLCGAFIHALLNGADEKQALRFGMKSAILSLQYEDGAISPYI